LDGERTQLARARAYEQAGAGSVRQANTATRTGLGPDRPVAAARAQRLLPAAGGGFWPQQAQRSGPLFGFPEVRFLGGCGLSCGRV